MQIPATSREFVSIPLDGPASAGDLTTLPPQVAIVPDKGEEPIETDWNAAAWIGGEVAILVGPGPGGLVFAEGDYMIFVRLTAGAERPVMKAGRLRIGQVG